MKCQNILNRPFSTTFVQALCTIFAYQARYHHCYIYDKYSSRHIGPGKQKSHWVLGQKLSRRIDLVRFDTSMKWFDQFWIFRVCIGAKPSKMRLVFKFAPFYTEAIICNGRAFKQTAQISSLHVLKTKFPKLLPQRLIEKQDLHFKKITLYYIFSIPNQHIV